MTIIDTHAHLFVDEFLTDLPAVIARAKSAGVSRVYMPNIDCDSFQSLMRVSAQYPDYCFPTLGLHPTSVGANYSEELRKLKLLLENSQYQFAAIGEVGLDLYWDKTYKKEQEKAFREQVEWSLLYNLPLVIHSRNAFVELYSILSEYKSQNISGIFHCFDGTIDEAEMLMEFENFMLGINGVLTFKKSELPEVLKMIPIERIVLETDSPYLAPVPKRGKRNESSYIKYTLSRMADIYNLKEEKVAAITSNNALSVFEKRKM